MKTRDLLKYINIRLVVQYHAIEDIPRKTRNRNNAQHEQDVEKDDHASPPVSSTQFENFSKKKKFSTWRRTYHGIFSAWRNRLEKHFWTHGLDLLGRGWVSSLVDERASKTRRACPHGSARHYFANQRGLIVEVVRHLLDGDLPRPGETPKQQVARWLGAGVRSHSCSLRTDHRGHSTIPTSQWNWVRGRDRFVDILVERGHDLVRCNGVRRSTGRARSGRTCCAGMLRKPWIPSESSRGSQRSSPSRPARRRAHIHCSSAASLSAMTCLSSAPSFCSLSGSVARVGEGSVQLLLSVVELRNGPLELRKFLACSAIRGAVADLLALRRTTRRRSHRRVVAIPHCCAPTQVVLDTTGQVGELCGHRRAPRWCHRCARSGTGRAR